MPYGKPCDCAPAGIQWELATPPADPWVAIAYSPSLNRILMVAGNGDTAFSDNGGVNWTAGGATGVTLNDVAWSPAANLFVAVALNNNSVFLSADGVAWVPQATAVAQTHRAITWAGAPINLFIAGANNVGGSVNDIETSPDGVVWTAQATPDMNGAITGIGYNDDTGAPRLVVSNNVGRIMNSIDALGWNEASPALGAEAFRKPVWARELGFWIVPAGSNLDFARSPTGAGAWVGTPIPAQNGWSRTAWNGTRFLCVGTLTGNRLMTSQDGITWVLNPFPEQNWNDVLWIPELQRFIACAGTGTNRVIISQ